MTSFSDYLSSLPGLVHNENGPLIFPKSVAIQYHKKMRKQLLWPLRVALDQVYYDLRDDLVSALLILDFYTNI